MLLSSIMLNDREIRPTVDELRLRVAEAWGTMGAAWGVPPAVARVHGYLLACRGPMTERQVRDALGLSHRAASLALERTVALGLADRVDGQRVGARGPVGIAYQVLDDDWEWFGRVIAERKRSEADPVVAAIAELAADVAARRLADPMDGELAELGDWLARFHGFLLRFDRAIGLVPALAPRELEALLIVAGGVSDETIVRLVRLLAQLSPADLAALADVLAGLPPGAVRPAVRALAVLAGRRPR